MPSENDITVIPVKFLSPISKGHYYTGDGKGDISDPGQTGLYAAFSAYLFPKDFLQAFT